MQNVSLIMLPGLDGTGLLFKRVLQYLPASIKPIVVNYPSAEKLGYRDLVPLVQKKLPADRPFVILGESFGGPLALLVADQQPVGLRGIILSASFITCPYPLVPAMVGKAVPGFPFRMMAPISKLTGTRGGYWTEESHRALSSVAPGVWVHRIREILHINVSAELARVTQPLLYIQGRRDRVVPGFNLKKIVNIRDDVQSVVLDSNHMIMQTMPRDAAMAITDFIAKIPEEFV